MGEETKFRGSYAGIGAMLRSKWMLIEMVKRAELVKAHAEMISPVGMEGTAADPAGGYKQSFHVVPIERGGSKHDRSAALVVNDDPAAMHVEYGSVAQPGDHTMLKALEILRTDI